MEDLTLAQTYKLILDYTYMYSVDCGGVDKR